MGGIVAEHPFAAWPGHDVEVVQVIAMGGGHGMIAARHHDDVAVVNGDGFVNGPIIGVDTLEGEALRRVYAVVVGFLKVAFLGQGIAVVMQWQIHFV